jgi:hypothetical protein
MRARRNGICKSVGFVSELQPCCIVCLSSVVLYSSWLKNGGEGIGSDNGIVPYQVVLVITWHYLTPSNYRRGWRLHARSQRVHVLEHDTRTPLSYQTHHQPLPTGGERTCVELHKGSLPPPGSRESPAGGLLLLEPRSRQVFSSRERVGLAGGGETRLLSGLSELWYRAQAVYI